MIGYLHLVYFLPTLFCFFSIIFSWDKSLRNDRLLFYYFSSIIILIFGTRGNIDVDYSGYLENYNSISVDFNFENVREQYGEILSNYVNVIFRYLNFTYVYLLLFLTSTSIFLKAKIISNYSRFPLAVISIYFCLALIETEMITIRWAVSSSFLILSLINYSKSRFISFIYLFISVGFHSFSFLYFLVLPIINIKQSLFYYYLILFCLITGLFFPMEYISSTLTFYENTQNYTFNKIASYSSQDENTIGLFSWLLILYLFFLVIFFRLAFYLKKIKIEVIDQKLLQVGLVCLGVSLLFIKYKVFFYRANLLTEFFLIVVLINMAQELVNSKVFKPSIYFFIILPFVFWNIIDVLNQVSSKNIIEYKNAILSSFT